MDRELFSLARQGTLRKKRSSLLVFLVLLLSFTFAIVSLALVSSINATNRDFRYKIYGRWYCGLMTGTPEDGEWLRQPEQQKWIDSLGTARNCGQVPTSAGFAALGTLDDGMLDVGCITLDDGRWPKTADEIAIEGPVLSAMGLDETLGQQITLAVRVPCGEGSVTVEKTYTLCGVIHRYSTLWVLTQNPTNQLLVSMAVTDEAADALLAEAAQMAGKTELTPMFQYFVGVEGEENQFYSSFWIAAHLQETRGPMGERVPCVNGAAYPTYVKERVYDRFYLNIIAAVALIAVLCVYTMQLPADIHSFAVLRSIGITKLQMARLVLYETLLLLAPAILLGIPLAALGTWLSMKLLVFSGSVPVTVVIPFGQMCKVILLWLAGIAAARLLMFFITIHMPLTGRFQLSHKKARLARAGRSVLIVALLCILGSVTIFTQMNTYEPKQQKERYAHRYHYSIIRDFFESEGVVPESTIEDLRQLPGIVSTECVSLSFAGLSYDEMPERTARFYIVDESDCWDSVLNYGSDRDAFFRGEIVLLCFPTEDDVHTSEAYLLPGETEDNWTLTLPTDKIHLNFYSADGALQAQSEATPVIRMLGGVIGYYTHSNGLDFSAPYTVVCSKAYFERVLDTMTPNALWGESYYEFEPGSHEDCGNYVAGEEFGYQKVLMRVDTGIASGGTDAVVSNYCKEHDLILYNVRQEMVAAIQQADQELILLYSSGGCILLVALVLLASALSLEAEQEKRSYSVLRAIGMSRRQMRRRVLGKALGSSLIAALGGWIIYLIYALRDRLDWLATDIPGIREALEPTWNNWGYYVLYVTFHDWKIPAVLTALCLLVPLAVCLLAKRSLLKGEIHT